MKVNELTQYPEFTCVNESALSDKEIECGYVGDLLSWVMGNADAGCAWVTIQTHVNIVAVAVLVALYTGRAVDFFLLQIASNAAR